MKLSRKARVFLGVGIFAVLMGSLVMAYLQQGQEQDRLSQELSAAELLFDKQEADFASEKFPLRVGILESQLTRIESELDTVKTQLHRSIESTKATETCFEVAEASGVEIIEIGSPDLTIVNLEGVSFSVLTFTAKAEGDVSDLIHFILELSGQFPTGVEEAVEINVEERLASIRLRIHTYEGD